MLRNTLLIGLCTIILGLISWTLWKYTLKNYLPTILPDGYIKREVNDEIYLGDFPIHTDKPVLLHFFNPECSCSRFNLTHLRKLIETYGQQIEFKIILQIEDQNYNWQELEQEENLNTPYFIDFDGTLAKACGVYSTPQAVILTSTQHLYYRGNYNQAKYCTNPNSNFAQMALDSLLASRPAPDFGLVATLAYGCELPQETFQYEN